MGIDTAFVLQLCFGAAVWAIGWFIVSLLLRRNDVADIAWGLEFVGLVWWVAVRASERTLVTWIVVALVTAWGLRLAYHITKRFVHKNAEDARYAQWRQEWGKWVTVRSFGQVFVLQAYLALLIALPAIIIAQQGLSVGVWTVVGIVVWCVGYIFEVVGDYQLKQFLADTNKTHTVMTRGLWKYTRHPNYFGEATMWWGIAIIALPASMGWVGILGAITITLLLLFVSGVPLAERAFEGNAEFEEYKKRTSVFFPLPPRK